jgi:phosphonate transport system ATP-binding protein
MNLTAPIAPLVRTEIIRTAGLTKALAKSPAPVLDGVSLSIGQGEAVAIVGANGAGKSTLLKCLVGLLPPTAGTIEIFGEALGAARKQHLRRHIGFVFQFHGLVGHLSALSNVVQGALGQARGCRAWH